MFCQKTAGCATTADENETDNEDDDADDDAKEADHAPATDGSARVELGRRAALSLPGK